MARPEPMGAGGVAALVVLLLATALLPSAASSRVLEGEAGGSGKGAPGPTAGSKRQQEAPPPTTAPKDSKQPSKGEGEKKGQAQGGAQPPPPPLPVQEKAIPPPPPGGSGPNDTGTKGKDGATEKLKEVMDKCDDSHKCSAGEEFSACLQLSDDVSISPVVIILNKGQNNITVNVKEASSIDIDKSPLRLAKGAYGQMAIKNISPDGWKIILNAGNGDCILHVSQPVSDWQQQFQQFAAYATRLNPIYGAYLFGFTVVLVGVVCLCCKFARRRSNGGVPYQQLEMSAPAPNSSGADNTTSTAGGWDDGWDDDWDDEEAPARPSDKQPAASVSANGLSLRSRADSKDGWDVDWDD